MEELSTKEIQEVELEILKTISDICREQNLRYCLAYGTLLGAVRHKGFIPWDDDLDIIMPREDYEELLKYLGMHKQSYKNLQVFNPETNPSYPYMITRISDDRYLLDVDNENDYGIGIFIDIYPYDGLGNTKEEALRFGLKGDRLSSLCFQATRQRFAMGYTKSIFRKIIKLPVYLFSKAVGKNFYQKKLALLAGEKPYDTSKYVGCVVWLSGGEKDIFKKEWFDEIIEAPFEKYNFCIPKEYDSILKHAYGDYMKLPPVNERVGHHDYIAYRK